MEELKRIEIYKIGQIMCAESCLDMANELFKKLKKDEEILEKYNTEENVKTFNINKYSYYFLMFDYYNVRSLSSSIDKNDIDNGWFIWLKDYRLNSSKSFDSIDEKYVYFYETYFDVFFNSLKGRNDYIDEAIWSFKQSKYHACACLLFSSIENVERSIAQSDPKQVFIMSQEVQKTQTTSVESFNNDYYQKFEAEMNNFLRNKYYSRSTADNPEPTYINRNRVMHGIFTRKVNKTDCLKLFVLLDSLIKFNDWLDSYRQMIKTSNKLI